MHVNHRPQILLKCWRGRCYGERYREAREDSHPVVSLDLRQWCQKMMRNPPEIRKDQHLCSRKWCQRRMWNVLALIKKRKGLRTWWFFFVGVYVDMFRERDEKKTFGIHKNHHHDMHDASHMHKARLLSIQAHYVWGLIVMSVYNTSLQAIYMCSFVRYMHCFISQVAVFLTWQCMSLSHLDSI
jgi:hypothetical protein